jgi:hypothetical protein
MKEWAGIYGNSFENLILDAVTELGSNLELAQKVASHRSQRSTRIYTQTTRLRDLIKVIDLIAMPGLLPHFNRVRANRNLTYYNL